MTQPRSAVNRRGTAETTLIETVQRTEYPDPRGFNGLAGALSIVAGIVLLVYPAISLLTLAVIVSIWLLALGVMEIALALQLRGIAHPAHAHPAPAT